AAEECQRQPDQRADAVPEVIANAQLADKGFNAVEPAGLLGSADGVRDRVLLSANDRLPEHRVVRMNFGMFFGWRSGDFAHDRLVEMLKRRRLRRQFWRLSIAIATLGTL